MNRSEAVAKCIVEAALPGADLRYVEDQSRRIHDFDLVFADGRQALLEVTRSTQQALKKLEAQIAAAQKGGLIPAKRCRNGWYVHLGIDASVRRVQRKIDDYLADVEAEGRNRFSSFTDSVDSAAVRRILQDLHVEAGEVAQWRNGPAIGVTGAGAGGCVAAGEVSRAVQEEAAKRDNRQKLTAPPGYESHIAVVFEWRSYAAWAALNGPAPEGCSVCLEGPITHAWAMANTRQAEEYVAWFAANGEPWRRLGVFTVTEAQIDATISSE